MTTNSELLKIRISYDVDQQTYRARLEKQCQDVLAVGPSGANAADRIT
jgi:hypothetical protein